MGILIARTENKEFFPDRTTIIFACSEQYYIISSLEILQMFL
jgi:hypothetical protein